MAEKKTLVFGIPSLRMDIFTSKTHLVLAIRMEVASLRPDHLPPLSAATTSTLSLLVKHHILAIGEAS